MIKSSLINIGDELLIGQVVNTNAAWIGGQLTAIGVALQHVHVIPDREEAIVQALRLALAQSDVVLLTGGLGPTKDDITKKVLADFFDTRLVFSEQVYAHYQKLSERFGRTVSEAVRRWQSMVPASAELLHNAMGVAPGMWFEREGKVVVSMPGVPVEMKYIMEQSVLPRLARRADGEYMLYRVVRTAVTGEPDVAALLENFEQELPPNMSLAYLPQLGGVRLRLTARGRADSPEAKNKLEQELTKKTQQMMKLLGEVAYAAEDVDLQEFVGELLRERGLCLATAESCTGGYLAHLITSVPGSSDYFRGSIVAYANEFKTELLGLSAETLKTHGAVSEACVKEMVRGACRLPGVDVGIATSGIAGPGGGTPEKPVGTIWVAVGNEQKQYTHLLQLGKNRQSNIAYTSLFALDMLRRSVDEFAPLI